MRNPLTYLFRAVRARFEARRRADSAGCCGCGSDRLRYSHADGWATCEACGPNPSDVTVLDYGQDVEITVGQLEDDIDAAQAEAIR